jgi:hypothetical protein
MTRSAMTGMRPASLLLLSAVRLVSWSACLRTLYPTSVRIAIGCDNFCPHLTTKWCRRVADWAEANNVEIACTRLRQVVARANVA